MVVVLDLMMVLKVFSKFNASVIPSQEKPKPNYSVLRVENFSDPSRDVRGFFGFPLFFSRRIETIKNLSIVGKKVKSPRS